MSAEPEVLRYAAFAAEPGGGNPAGIVLDASSMTDADMQATAAEVGFAETAFVTGRSDDAEPRFALRYFSPIAEVPFCGHATVATAVALAEREGDGTFHFDTAVGEVVIHTGQPFPDGPIVATFTSVDPEVRPLDPAVLTRLLSLLGLEEDALDTDYPVKVAYAGNRHPIVVLADETVFDGFTFDAASMRALMDEQGWSGTVTVLRALDDARFEARNLFPVGTMTEDPATGSAAAALGGYLRDLGLVEAPATVTILQGRHVGRPSSLLVDIPAIGGIRVSGGAAAIAD
ncbi:PhzF family phenazine biosynthesis protein [Herbiconiux sp. L3-i23]|uniref:PhzF family phenazine biosynthesis protein n=1 Tax=Herbiconiux sp. L3-i23 TaxID=2905871 RepID=UPI00205C26C0|nr:PhzF family phenazine biosynthesis isomerase [Herbiconiux sp. L3-i23]BDI22870.1 oxidoreductase [Herbiconiux sp. L3-i23]